jgi:caffeoyl-CoA O-methyltransferase
MTPKSAFLAPPLQSYLVDHSSGADDVLRDLAAETAALGGISSMQIAPEQGAFMGLLARLVRPRFAVEVGTFTGYSAICVARGLAPGGRLLCCDVSEEWTAVARRYWERAGVAESIELRLAPALDTLRALPAEASVDLAFVDADKGGYVAYWEELVPRLNPGGVLLVDNVLWSGRVVDPDAADDDTVALRAFNDHAAADERVELVMLPLADGLTMARRLVDQAPLPAGRP